MDVGEIDKFQRVKNCYHFVYNLSI